MKRLLYISSLRALTIAIDDGQWRVIRAFMQTPEDLSALTVWISQQHWKSLSVVLDYPGDIIELHELPSLTVARQRLLCWRLGRHFLHSHLLSASAVTHKLNGREVLRQLAIDSQFEHSSWYEILCGQRHRIRSVYAATLLLEQFLQPLVIIPTDTQIGGPQTDCGSPATLLLCATVGDNAICHICISQRRLYFKRVLDVPQDAGQFLSQLADTREYLQDKFGQDMPVQIKLAVTSDLASDWLIDRVEPENSVGYSLDWPGIDHVIETADRNESSTIEVGLSVTQENMFTFAAKCLTTYRHRRELAPARINWCHKSGKSADWTERYISQRLVFVCLRFTCFSITIALLLAGSVLAWRSHSVQADLALVQLELQNERLSGLNTESVTQASNVSPVAMRDTVLLHEVLISDSLNPLTFLHSLALHVTQSEHIALSEISWMRANTDGVTTTSVMPSMRSTSPITDGQVLTHDSILLRVSGHLASSELSVREAYSAFSRFSKSLDSDSIFRIVRHEKEPFDTAESKSARGREAHVSNEYGHFSLLLEVSGPVL